jgi:hypothetical protein
LGNFSHTDSHTAKSPFFTFLVKSSLPLSAVYQYTWQQDNEVDALISARAEILLEKLKIKAEEVTIYQIFEIL